MNKLANVSNRKQSGMSLIELVIAITLMGSGLAALMNVYGLSLSGNTSNSLMQQQSLFIAESMMEEIYLHDFYDPTVNPKTNLGLPAGTSVPCAGPNETDRTQFDDVCDYDGFTETGITSFHTGNSVAGLNLYAVSVAVVGQAFAGLTADQAVRITVTVTDPAGQNLVLQSYRSAY